MLQLEWAKGCASMALLASHDTYILLKRAKDPANGYNLFVTLDHVGVRVIWTTATTQISSTQNIGVEITDPIVFPGQHWEDIEFLKALRIVLKGIQSVHDAKKCVEAGVQGGGEQDGGVNKMVELPQFGYAVRELLDAVGDSDIFFDSGIRKAGALISKAVALGAKCACWKALCYEVGVRHGLRGWCEACSKSVVLI
ncbi:hypothetical protein CEK25_013503 [Fusarium fujikuroi]|nr:hypothetical protein CEK25_013503 [Fusarium fujikuroi]